MKRKSGFIFLTEQHRLDLRANADLTDKFSSMVGKAHSICAICFVVDQACERHNWRDCLDRGKVNRLTTLYNQFASKQEYGNVLYTGCFKCAMPLELCQAWETGENQYGPTYYLRNHLRCQYPETLRSYISAILLWSKGSTRKLINQSLGLAEGEMVQGAKETHAWLSERSYLGTLTHCSRLALVVFNFLEDMEHVLI